MEKRGSDRQLRAAYQRVQHCLHAALEYVDRARQSDASRSKLFIARYLWRLLPSALRKQVWNWHNQTLPYHRIVYRGRVLSFGRDRTAAYRAVFPDPPIGKTILDVGCNSGAYCFMAASEGASYTLGVDQSRIFIERGKELLKSAEIPNIDLLQADIFAAELRQSFDVVLCLNILHHLQSIERVDSLLDALYELTNEKLIMMIVITTMPFARYEYIRTGKTEQVLLSPDYFRDKFRSAHVEFTVVNPLWYGSNRGIVTVQKMRETTSERQF